MDCNQPQTVVNTPFPLPVPHLIATDITTLQEVMASPATHSYLVLHCDHLPLYLPPHLPIAPPVLKPLPAHTLNLFLCICNLVSPAALRSFVARPHITHHTASCYTATTDAALPAEATAALTQIIALARLLAIPPTESPPISPSNAECQVTCRSHTTCK